MNVQINQLVKTLLKKDSLEQCSLQELEQFAERHPYFGAAQLLLTKKLQSEKPERYDEQLQKTFLFFHNPLWVQHLLNDTGKAKIIVSEKKANGNGSAHAVASAVTDLPGQPEQHVPVVEVKADESIPHDTSIEETIHMGDHSVATGLPVVEEDDTSDPQRPAMVDQKQDAVPVEQENNPVTENKEKEELLFEPFHTVDYFASQGIKYKEEEKPADKFGKQLRSFTDWLKTMKKLPITEVGKTISPDLENKVVQLAEHSLDAKEVVTEAMAEVWIKQGNSDKAIEIYRKLSLLDPSKSVYFAAKIEELKKKN